MHHGEITVRDHGPGIPEDDHARVFDRFFRSDAARTMPGSGLGLAIVHQVVSDHGGTVVIEQPVEGDGVLIRIQLPLSQHTEPDDTHDTQHESHAQLEPDDAPSDTPPETTRPEIETRKLDDAVRVPSAPDD